MTRHATETAAEDLTGLSPFEKASLAATERQTAAMLELVAEQRKANALATADERRDMNREARVGEVLRQNEEQSARDAAERGAPFAMRLSVTLPMDPDDGDEPVEAIADVLFVRLTRAEIATDPRYSKSAPGEPKAQGVNWPSFSCPEGMARINAKLRALIQPAADELVKHGKHQQARDLEAANENIMLAANQPGAPVLRRNLLWSPYQKRLMGKTLAQILATGSAKLVDETPPTAA